MYILRYGLNDSSGSLHLSLAFTSCLGKASRAASSETLGSSQVFPEDTNNMCVALYIARTMSDLFKFPYGHLILQFFLLRFFFISLLLAPTIKQLPQIIFGKCPVGRAIPRD